MHQKIALIFILFVTQLTYAQDCEALRKAAHQRENGASSNNKCCVDSAFAADQELKNLSNTAEIIAYHAPFGTPKTKNKNEVLIVNPTFLAGYDTVNKINMWVQYRLKSKDEKKYTDRTDCFRYDPRFSLTAQVGYNDYKNKVDLQRGHMKSSSDGYGSYRENINTFLMTNMAPQYGAFNACEWQVLEKFVQKHSEAADIEEAYIISGSIVDGKSEWLNESVRIPSAFYKIYFFKQSGHWHYWTYYIPHDDQLMNFDEYMTFLNQEQKTIRYIEKKSKVNFYVIKTGINQVEKNLDSSFSTEGIGKYAAVFCNKYLN